MYSSDADKSQFDKMTKAPVKKLILTLGFPSMICILITHIYNLADTFFVGRLGTSASGAVGIVFGIMAILQAFGFMYGQGSGIIVSRLLGAKAEREANMTASVALFSAFVTGLLISLIGICLVDKILFLFGSTKTIFPFAKAYAIWIFLAAPFIMCSLTLNNLFRYQGKALIGTVGIGSGALVNIVMDPIFMFSFNLGTMGAGISTAISQCISSIILFMFFQSDHCSQHFHMRHVACFRKQMKPIVTAGLPAFFGQVLGILSTMMLNREAKLYGDSAIAGMSIVGRITFLMFAVGLGIAQGFQPVAGFNYGAQKYDRVRKGFRFTLILCELLLGTLAMACMMESDRIIDVFCSDAEVIEVGSKALFLQCIGVLFAPLLTCTNVLLQSAGKYREASLVSSMRNGLFFLPLILVLPQHLGLLGIEIAQPIADLLAFLVTLPFAVCLYRQLLNEEKRKEE